MQLFDPLRTKNQVSAAKNQVLTLTKSQSLLINNFYTCVLFRDIFFHTTSSDHYVTNDCAKVFTRQSHCDVIYGIRTKFIINLKKRLKEKN